MMDTTPPRDCDPAPGLTRRRFMAAALAGAAAMTLQPSRSFAQDASAPDMTRSDDATTRPLSTHRYRIGVSDLMLLKRQTLGAFPIARDIGVDGVEVDMGGLGKREHMDNKLLDPQERARWMTAAREHGLHICSLAMTAFFAQNYAEHPKADLFTEEWIDLLKIMGAGVGFLPMGVPVKLKEDPDARDKVIARLRRAAPRAEAAGVVLGIETGLDVDDQIAFLDAIGSPAVRTCYNFGPALDAGYDIYAALQKLGKDRLAQIHCTDRDGAWLENNTRLDMPRVKSILDEIGWSGWLVMERSRVGGKSVRENFGANARYLKSVFQA